MRMIKEEECVCFAMAKLLLPAYIECPGCGDRARITAAIKIGMAARYDCPTCGRVLIARIVEDDEQ